MSAQDDLREMRGLIAALPDDQQRRVHEIAATMRAAMESDPLTVLAYALVGVEEGARPASQHP